MSITLRAAVSLCGILVALSAPVSAQENSAPDFEGSARHGAAANAPIFPGDQVSIKIFREPEFSGVFTVADGGDLVLPRLGRLPVSGRSARSLEDSLVSAYGTHLRNPTIEVVVLRRVSVHGEVRKPDVYMVDLREVGAALEPEGVRPDLIPEQFIAEAVVEALAAEIDLRGSGILLPRAEVARSVLPVELQARGAEVVEVAAYRTVPDGGEVDAVRERLRDGSVDVVTFTASSTVLNFVDLVGTGIGDAKVASIRPITSAAARERGLPVHVEATEYTIPGLIRAIRSHYGSAD
ncbi:hypothetical protein BH23GEM3_BH23GEM3_00900 [soil metagenome]|nr:uroporphyrinogen-III synthase [Gemmatimonadota bacterium]